MTASPQTISDADRRVLLALARESITATVTRDRLPERPDDGGPVLDEPRGVFVTLHRYGELRGCIGVIEAVKPLWLAVRDAAISAATRDPRFRAVEPDELPVLHLEISALTPMQKVTSRDEVIVGRHGLFIENGYRSGLLLPQVATEWGWDRDTFIAHTCRKAGLPPDAANHPDTRLYVFSAEIFNEDELADADASDHAERVIDLGNGRDASDRG